MAVIRLNGSPVDTAVAKTDVADVDADKEGELVSTAARGVCVVRPAVEVGN